MDICVCLFKSHCLKSNEKNVSQYFPGHPKLGLGNDSTFPMTIGDSCEAGRRSLLTKQIRPTSISKRLNIWKEKTVWKKNINTRMFEAWSRSKIFFGHSQSIFSTIFQLTTPGAWFHSEITVHPRTFRGFRGNIRGDDWVTNGIKWQCVHPFLQMSCNC